MISRDAVSEDVFGEKKSVYRAEVDIIENNLTSLPEGFKLLPSMNVTGNIKSGTRKQKSIIVCDAGGDLTNFLCSSRLKKRS